MAVVVPFVIQTAIAIGASLLAQSLTTIRGPRIGDLGQQTSREGVPRPIVWALSPPMAGNIIATGEPRIVRSRQRQGKGGPRVETESVYRTYAIRVCEGPITGFVRVWRNGTLVYDVSDAPLVAPDDNAFFLERARFFLGDWDQLPSPDLEAIHGAGTTPAYRGTAYMVMADEDLTDLRGAIPQWIFQVERCEGVFLTSRPYALELSEDIGLAAATHGGVFQPVVMEEMTVSVTALGGTLETELAQYEHYAPEAIELTATALDGDLDQILQRYEHYAPEAIEVTATALDGDLDDVLQKYQNYAPEAIGLSVIALDGDLS